MKKLSLLFLMCACFGCHHSEFDVSPSQVSNAHVKGPGGPGGMPDLDHLPPGAVKHVTTFKKGDRLPDGTIADGDRKIVRVEIPKGSVPGPAGDGKHIIVTDDEVRKP